MSIICVPNRGKIIDNIRRKITSPCKDCKDRKAACHSTCAAYNEYKRNLEKEKAKVETTYKHECVFQEFVVDGKKKTIKRQKRK